MPRANKRFETSGFSRRDRKVLIHRSEMPKVFLVRCLCSARGCKVMKWLVLSWERAVELEGRLHYLHQGVTQGVHCALLRIHLIPAQTQQLLERPERITPTATKPITTTKTRSEPLKWYKGWNYYENQTKSAKRAQQRQLLLQNQILEPTCTPHVCYGHDRPAAV